MKQMMKRGEKRVDSRFRNISIFMSINRLRGTSHRIKNNTFFSPSFSLLLLLPCFFCSFALKEKREERKNERRERERKREK